MNRIIETSKNVVKIKNQHVLNGNTYRVATLPKSYLRNHHAKFKIDRTILASLKDSTLKLTEIDCETSMAIGLLICRFLAIIIFFTLFTMSLVLLVKITKFLNI